MVFDQDRREFTEDICSVLKYSYEDVVNVLNKGSRTENPVEVSEYDWFLRQLEGKLFYEGPRRLIVVHPSACISLIQIFKTEEQHLLVAYFRSMNTNNFDTDVYEICRIAGELLHKPEVVIIVGSLHEFTDNNEG